MKKANAAKTEDRGSGRPEFKPLLTEPTEPQHIHRTERVQNVDGIWLSIE